MDQLRAAIAPQQQQCCPSDDECEYGAAGNAEHRAVGDKQGTRHRILLGERPRGVRGRMASGH